MARQTLTRREALATALAGIAALPALARAEDQASTPARIDEKEKNAVALGYLHDATKVDADKNPLYKAGQTCLTCLQIQGKDGEAWRPCGIFPGKLVNTKGWCKVWVKKP